MRPNNRLIPPPVITLLLSLTVLLLSTGYCLSDSQAANESPPVANVESMMAGLSDEQVRQLLIDELKKDAEIEELSPQQMKGPAVFLSRLLSIMSRGHAENTGEVRAMFGSFSTMGPDLYKVFIKL